MIEEYMVEESSSRGPTGVLHEQADVAVNITANNATPTDVFDLNAANTRYVVRDLKLKTADPGLNTITVYLKTLINGTPTQISTATFTTADYDTPKTLMDMFGLPFLAGDDIQVYVQCSAGGPYSVLGQYSYAKTNV